MFSKRGPHVSSEPTVSVVVPCWRCSGTIRRAVASIAAQTRPPVEVILVDDASGDGTLDVLKEISAAHPEGWIKVIQLDTNVGPGEARNRGWNLAVGDYLAFLDADDAWHPRKLEIQLGWMASHPYVALTGHQTGVYDKRFATVDMTSAVKVRRVRFFQLLIVNYFATRTVVLKRALPLRFEGRDVAEDFLMWARVAATGALCYRVEAMLAFSFKPEFDAGGYSGELWTAQKRVIASHGRLHEVGELSTVAWLAASAWGWCTFARRLGIRIMRAAARALHRPAARSPRLHW